MQTRIQCILVCNYSIYTKEIKKKLDVEDAKLDLDYFDISIGNARLSVNAALRKYDGVVFDEQIDDAQIIIYRQTVLQDNLDNRIKSAEKNYEAEVIRITDDNVDQIIEILQSKIELIKKPSYRCILQAQRYQSLIGLVYEIANQPDYWKERFSPSVVKQFMKIIQNGDYSLEKKWDKIMIAANEPATSSKWFIGSLVHDRHPDATAFCEAVKMKKNRGIRKF